MQYRTTYILQGQWIRGIIDQLELDESGRIRVVENKTRRKPSLPMLAQQETAKLQVWIMAAKTGCGAGQCIAMISTLVFEVYQHTCQCGSSHPICAAGHDIQASF